MHTAAEILHEATRKRAHRPETTGIQSCARRRSDELLPFPKRKRRTKLCIHRIWKVKLVGRVEESGDHCPLTEAAFQAKL